MRRRHLVLVSAAVVVAIAVTAAIDHRHKAHQMARASVANWTCVHRGRRCDVENKHEIERRWNRRESAYLAGIGLVVLANCAPMLVAAMRRKTSL
jgi:hypothetical protein